ncbi:Pisatin demethylase [Paramyrothecium foliicola]|nr:Pisatin demethylase [Paramyrothecium foliicola]
MAIITVLYEHALSLLAVFSVLYVLRKLFIYNRLRQFGGHAWTGFSDWPHSLAILRKDCHEWYAEANEKYGPIARIGPNLLITSSPEVWVHVNKEPEYKRSDWFYHALRIEYRRDNVFTMTDNAQHEKRRLQMMPGYSGRENLDLEKSIDESIQKLLNLVRNKYISTETRAIPMDLAKKVQYLTLDVISGVGLGKTFGMLDADSDIHDYLKSTEDGLLANQILFAMGLSWLVQAPIIGKFIAPAAGDGSSYGHMMQTCYQYVNDRASNPTDKRSDMLASFMRHGLRDDALRSEATEQIIAGSDTTAGSIRAILLHVITNPRVYSTLQKEIDDAVRDGKAPAAGEGIISAAQGKQLPYLQAVIREGWRMWPPVPSFFSRDVPRGGDVVEVDGKDVYIPGGTYLGYSGNAMHRNKDIYGEDSNVFRPERWFEPNEEKLDRMLRTIELTFGHGRWKCLGKPVAQLEIVKTVFEMLRNFDIALIDPTKPWNAQYCIGLFIISDMWVQVMARDN